MVRASVEVKKSWVANSTKRIKASVMENLKFAITTKAKSDWAAVKKISSDCLASITMGPIPPLERLYTKGSMPTRRVHWFTLEEIRVPRLAVAWAPRAKRMATMNSGDSEAKGASHWTKMNSSMPQCRPVSNRASAKGSAAMKIV